MGYNEAYALLLTHEARLEQAQNAKDMFNANYSLMNANYSQIRGNVRRGSYGSRFHGFNGHFGNRGSNFDRGMFLNNYPRGFPIGSGDLGSYDRGQQMQFHRSAPKIIAYPTGNSLMHSGESNEPLPICQICHK